MLWLTPCRPITIAGCTSLEKGPTSVREVAKPSVRDGAKPIVDRLAEMAVGMRNRLL